MASLVARVPVERVRLRSSDASLRPPARHCLAGVSFFFRLSVMLLRRDFIG